MKKSNEIKPLEGHDLPVADVLLGLGFFAIFGVSVFLLIADLIA